MKLDYVYDHNDGAYGYGVVALRTLNAIPYVVDAKPGILSAIDLPLTVVKGTFR